MNGLILGLGLLTAGAAQATTLPSGTCGNIKGSLDQRIAQCATLYGADATQIIITEIGTFTWKMVEQNQFGKRAWRDETSKLVWTDVADEMRDQDGGIELCDMAEEGKEIKGNYTYYFILPEKKQFETGHAHGLSQVLPNLEGRTFWSSTSWGAIFYGQSWYYDPTFGNLEQGKVGELHSLRCIGWGG